LETHCKIGLVFSDGIEDGDDTCIPTPKKTKRNKQENTQLVQYLSDKADKDFKLRQQEIDIRKQQLEMDEKRRQQDAEERSTMLQLMQTLLEKNSNLI